MPRSHSLSLRHSLPLLAVTFVLLLTTASTAHAQAGTWATDIAVGPSEASYQLTFTCTGPVAVCEALNLYDDTQVSTLSDGATLVLDDLTDTLQFDVDGNVDLDDGMGPIPTSPSLSGTNMMFAGLALFGIPEVQNPLVFSADQPLVALPGLALLPPGTYPISTTMNWGGIADVIGDVSLFLPRIIVPPAPVSVTGTLEILGDIDSDGFIEFEIQALQTTVQSTDQYTEAALGLVVDVHVTAGLLLNLSGEVAAPAPVPMLGGPVALGLAGLLAALGAVWLARREA